MRVRTSKPQTKETSTLFTGGWVLIGDTQESREEHHLKFENYFFAFWSINYSIHFHTVGGPCFQHLKYEQSESLCCTAEINTTL